MQNRSKIINKLALVLLSIVVLELILIGDQVQPVKGIKKKIFVKKLKKLLPLLALVKPKKKIILVPIPIPMFKNHPGHTHPHMGAGHHHYPHLHGMMRPHHGGTVMPPHSPSIRPQTSTTKGGPGGGAVVGSGHVPPSPMSFMMMNVDSMGDSMDASMLPMSMAPASSAAGQDSIFNMMSFMSNSSPPPPPTPAPPASSGSTSSTTTAQPVQPNGADDSRNRSPPPQVTQPEGSSPSSSSSSMMLPSMTMTIQSEPGGSSAIELSTNMATPTNPNTTLAALMRRPAGHSNRWSSQLQQQHHQPHYDATGFDEPADEQQHSSGPGEPYYNSPWSANRVTSSSIVSGKLQLQPPPHQQQQQPVRNIVQITSSPPPMSTSGGAARSANQQSLPPQQPQTMLPVLVIQNQWRPSRERTAHQARDVIGQRVQLPQQQQEAVNKALEHEELVAVGPARMMHFYQTQNGQLHMSPPPPPTAHGANNANHLDNHHHLQQQQQEQVGEQEEHWPFNSNLQDFPSSSSSNKTVDLNEEVQTISPQSNANNVNSQATATPTRTSNLTESVSPISSSSKNAQPKQQQQQQQQQQQKKTSQRYSSPASKGKQQQQQRYSNKSPTNSGGAGY